MLEGKDNGSPPVMAEICQDALSRLEDEISTHVLLLQVNALISSGHDVNLDVRNSKTILTNTRRHVAKVRAAHVMIQDLRNSCIK